MLTGHLNGVTYGTAVILCFIQHNIKCNFVYDAPSMEMVVCCIINVFWGTIITYIPPLFSLGAF